MGMIRSLLVPEVGLGFISDLRGLFTHYACIMYRVSTNFSPAETKFFSLLSIGSFTGLL